MRARSYLLECQLAFAQPLEQQPSTRHLVGDRVPCRGEVILEACADDREILCDRAVVTGQHAEELDPDPRTEWSLEEATHHDGCAIDELHPAVASVARQLHEVAANSRGEKKRTLVPLAIDPRFIRTIDGALELLETSEVNRRDQRIDHRRHRECGAIDLALIAGEQGHVAAAVSGACSRVCRNRRSG